MVIIHTDHATELIRYFDAAATDNAAAGASPVAEEEQSAIAELTSDVAAFGYEGDPMRLLFERGFAPTHAFSAGL